MARQRYTHRFLLIDSDGVRYGWRCTAVDRGGSELAGGDIVGGGEWDKVCTGRLTMRVDNSWTAVDLDDFRYVFSVQAVEQGNRATDGRGVVRIFMSRRGNRRDPVPFTASYQGVVPTFNGKTFFYRRQLDG